MKRERGKDRVNFDMVEGKKDIVLLEPIAQPPNPSPLDNDSNDNTLETSTQGNGEDNGDAGYDTFNHSLIATSTLY